MFRKYCNFTFVLAWTLTAFGKFVTGDTSEDLSPLARRSFSIDFDSNAFLKDGEKFQYVSGSIHYFRIQPGAWRDRLRKMRYGGLNAIETYITWAEHEPEPGQYNFTGPFDLESFIKIAQEEDLLVILRVGPYICAERDMGGLPYWLLKLHPFIRLRSSDPNYVKRVDSFLSKALFPRVKPLLYENGGPIIMVQVENEYGNFYSCDYSYTSHLRDVFRLGLGNSVVLFTTDNGSTGALKCGKIPEVYATVDFGISDDPLSEFGAQKLFEPRGPLVVSEFYSGWLNHWGEERHRVDGQVLSSRLDRLLSMGANVNMYMFHGGTNFGLTSGSNSDSGHFKSCLTSYDYDAPISEAGDLTTKYNLLKNVIKKYFPVPESNPPSNSSKAQYGDITMSRLGHPLELAAILKNIGKSVENRYPLTFEELGVSSGIVIYSTNITFTSPDPCVLELGSLNDRGYVFVNGVLRGISDRGIGNSKLGLRIEKGDSLSIIVESMGRISAGTLINDAKGLTSNLYIGNNRLINWSMVPLPLTNEEEFTKAMLKLKISKHLENIHHEVGKGGQSSGYYLSNADEPSTKKMFRKTLDYIQKLFSTEDQMDSDSLLKVPRSIHRVSEKSQSYSESMGFYEGTLDISASENEPRDTFLKLDGWTKGIAWINSYCLGRYWPVMGPQVTLYVPKELLKSGSNKLTLLELERVDGCGDPSNHHFCASFVDTPILDGPVPQK